MQLLVDSAWRKLTGDEVEFVPDRAGVYELADAHGRVIYMGIGLPSLHEEMIRYLDSPGSRRKETVTYFRFEPTPNPSRRYEALLKEYQRKHKGAVSVWNEAEVEDRKC